MNDVNDIPKLIAPYLRKIGRYVPLLFILFVLGLYGYLVLHVNQLTQTQVSETDVQEVVSESPELKIDRRAIEAIERLEDQNVEVEAIFQEARDNPFAEISSDDS